MATKRMKPTKEDMQREVEKAYTYPSYYYLKYALLEGDVLTPSEQRTELKHLLAVARSRQAHLRKSKFAGSEAAQVKFPTMSQLKTDRQVSNALAEVALFIRSRRSTVKGAEQYQSEIVKTLQTTFAGQQEVDFADPAFNWKAFGAYMWELKRQGKASEGHDSEQAVRLFFLAKGTGLTSRGLLNNYEQFQQRQAELENLYHNNPYGRRAVSGENMLARLDDINN